ncbi:MAG: tetratricopeptide repeat protein [Chloroflexota bacterium]
MHYQSSLGLWVKTFRTTRRWTQRELAEQIGCSVSTISKIEIDERYPSRQLAQLLAYHLEVPADELATFLGLAYSSRQLPQNPTFQRPSSPTPICNQYGFRPLTAMLGRDLEMTNAVALLQRSEVRLLTIVGPGGVGKTRLAYALADQLNPMFAQGVQILDLTSIASVDELLLLLATTLELPNPSGDSLIDRVLVGLQGQELLLVLDNIDHLFSAISIIRQILATVPKITFLLTSRAPLRIDGEYEFRIAPLAIPTETDIRILNQLAMVPSVALFVARAHAINPEFELNDANSHAIATICQQVDGLPLALELAAAQLRVWRPQSLAARIAQDITILTSTSRDASSYQHSLSATVRWSYHLLRQKAQQLFASMSVFVGGATLEAITVICTDPEDERAKQMVSQHLNTLLEYSLVAAQDSRQGDRRFTMLETIRAVAGEELRTVGDTTLLRERHAAYFTQWSETYTGELEGAQQVVFLQRFEQEMGNIRTALVWSYDHRAASLLARLCMALWRFWYLRGLWDEGLLWHKRALTLIDLLPSTLQAPLLSGAGGFSLMLNDYGCATTWLDEAIEQYRRLDQPLGLAQTFNRLGIVRWDQGQLMFAQQTFEEGLAHARQAESLYDIATILANLGCVVNEQGQYDQAIAFHQASLQVRRRLDDAHGIVHDLLNLGNSVLLQGDYATAQACFEEGLTYTRKWSYHYKEGLLLINVGVSAGYQMRLTEAHRYITEGLAIVRRFQDRLNEAQALNALGLVAFFDADIDTAIKLLHQSIHIFVALDSWINIPECLERLAYVFIHQAEYQQAKWFLVGAAQMRLEEGSKRPPVEERLYEQAWEQLNIQGFTGENTSGWVVGRIRDQLGMLIAQDLAEAPSIPLLDVAAGR